jgi:hypothetical protein
VDQGAIASLKAYYLRRISARLVKAIDNGDRPKEFWKPSNVLDTLNMVKPAWNRVTNPPSGEVGRNLRPEFDRGVETFLDATAEATSSVLEVANRQNLEVCPEDVSELLNSHVLELKNEDFWKLENKLKNNLPPRHPLRQTLPL